jgi:hypothetical protein
MKCVLEKFRKPKRARQKSKKRGTSPRWLGDRRGSDDGRANLEPQRPDVNSHVVRGVITRVPFSLLLDVNAADFTGSHTLDFRQRQSLQQAFSAFYDKKRLQSLYLIDILL